MSFSKTTCKGAIFVAFVVLLGLALSSCGGASDPMVLVTGGEFEFLDYEHPVVFTATEQDYRNFYPRGTQYPFGYLRKDGKLVKKASTDFEPSNTNLGVLFKFEPAKIKVADFKIAKTETTYEQWYDVYKWATSAERGDKRYKFKCLGTEGFAYGVQAGTAPTERKNHPVTEVSYIDAMVWCNAFSEKEGLEPVYYTRGEILRDTNDERLNSQIIDDYVPMFDSYVFNDDFVCDVSKNGYRLPSMKEWLFAARGGDPKAVDWGYKYAGGDVGVEVAWLGDECKKNLKEKDPRYGTKAVATKKPNRLGLYDMSGNVSEFCSPYVSVPKFDDTCPEQLTVELLQKNKTVGMFSSAYSNEFGYICISSNDPEGKLLRHEYFLYGSWRDSAGLPTDIEYIGSVSSAGLGTSRDNWQNYIGFRVAQSVIK